MPRHFPNSQSVFNAATLVRLERRLPNPGDISVRVGNRVEPDDLIGQCTIQPDPILLDIAGALRIEPRDLHRQIQRGEGERVAFRDVLARRRNRSILAPRAGRLEHIDAATGFVSLMPDPMPTSVTAMLRGYISEVEPGRSATIEAAAAIIQGAAGFGGERWGALRILTHDAGEVITAEMIDAQCAFTIVIGGGGITAEALQAAQREQVAGIIVGSIDADDVRAFWGTRCTTPWSRLLRTGDVPTAVEDLPALMITEGFGHHPMNHLLFDALKEFDRQEGYLDATMRLGAPQRRPRLIIPVTRFLEDVAEPAPVRDLRVGSMVRLLDEAHLGQAGRVERIHAHGRLPSGARAPTATVLIGGGQRLVVPALMLEVLG